MLRKPINKIKAYFFALSAGVIVLMLAGVFVLKNNPYFSNRYLSGVATGIMYRLELAQSGGMSASDLLRSVFGNRVQYANPEQNVASVPVLAYHGITAEGDNNYAVPTERFKEQMFALKRAGYVSVTTEALLAYLHGERNLPDKAFVITFDDGRKDAYYNADPVLGATGFIASMYVIGRFSIDSGISSYYLSPDELERMHESGRWEIEAHTDNGHGNVPVDRNGSQDHFFSNKMWLAAENRLETDREYSDRISTDLESIRSKIENQFGYKPIGFAIPFGDHGQESTNFASSSKIMLGISEKLFPLIFYQYGPGDRFLQNYFDPSKQNRNSFLIKRIDVNPSWSGDDLLAELGKSAAKQLPYHDNLTANRGWILGWGHLSLVPAGLTLTSEEKDTGGAIVLDGTGAWTDYRVTATVNDPGRSVVYLWVRFKDESNAAACNFGNGFAHIEQATEGNERVIKGVKDPSIRIPAGDVTITATVRGRHIECSLGDIASISSDYLDESLNQGGIGFKSWDRNSTIKLVVKSINVVPLDDGGEIAEVPN